MKNIAIIPARSGSKGLKDKNIKLLNGFPLISYSIKAAQESGLFDEIMVSTDSEKYASVAKQYGASIPFLRSNEQSGDNASSWDVVKEVLNNYDKIGKRFDTVCLLQPTSPLRKAQNIVDGYNIYNEKNVDAITSVCEMDHSPLWAMTLTEDHSLIEFRKKLLETPRQNLKQYYRINGALYIRKIEYSDNKINIIDEKEFAYIMDRKLSVDIDVQEDFEYAEFLMNK